MKLIQKIAMVVVAAFVMASGKDVHATTGMACKVKITAAKAKQIAADFQKDESVYQDKDSFKTHKLNGILVADFLQDLFLGSDNKHCKFSDIKNAINALLDPLSADEVNSILKITFSSLKASVRGETLKSLLNAKVLNSKNTLKLKNTEKFINGSVANNRKSNAESKANAASNNIAVKAKKAAKAADPQPEQDVEAVDPVLVSDPSQADYNPDDPNYNAAFDSSSDEYDEEAHQSAIDAYNGNS